MSILETLGRLELAQAFLLGNAAILANVCMLPLYPGLIAFLAGSASSERARRATGWLGVLVLAGILSMMIAIGFVLYVVQQSFGALLSAALPLVYGAVIVLGLLMLAGRSPFARLSTAQAPVIRSPYAMAYVYGLLFAPMTLPCTGPVILGAFLTGAGDAGALLEGIVFFLFFGLGFGWPLLVLPLLAVPFQRRFVGFLTRHHLMMARLSGALLVAVGVFGFITELLPQWTGGSIEFVGAPALIYWALAALAAAVVGYLTYRAEQTPASLTDVRQSRAD